MDNKQVFISHATKDDAFVKKLRTALESLNIPVWTDSRKLRGGDKLKPEIEKAIEIYRHVAKIDPEQISPSRRIVNIYKQARREDEARSAALERKIGQQALEIDFLQQALRRVEDLRHETLVSGGGGSANLSGPRRGKAS